MRPVQHELRSNAEALAYTLPALLADARRLASSVVVGEHGRKRAGQGDLFWQFRPAQNHDERRFIDWRRSARSDNEFVREREWQIAQTVNLWVDPNPSMTFSSLKSKETKGDRARLLALSTAILLLNGGERVGLIGQDSGPKRGHAQIEALASAMLRSEGMKSAKELSAAVPPKSTLLIWSDFLGDLAPLEAALEKAAGLGVSGVIIQVLDPAEESFPFDGRTVFENMGGDLTYETQKAGGLRQRYLARLAERKEHLNRLARQSGWEVLIHHTDQPATSALLSLYNLISRSPR